MVNVYLALGSNIGDRSENLHTALRLIEEAPVQLTKISSIYETEPVDFLEQAWFLNAVAAAETDLSALDLLHALRGIETRMGSKKAFAKGPRLIDLDILLYGDETITTPELQVPHPSMLQRNFVLIPLAEIAPTLRHPSWQGTVVQTLALIADRSIVRKYQPLQPGE